MSAVISQPYVVQHVIAEREVLERAMRLISLLVASGEDPCGLIEEDFVPIVMRQELADWISRAIHRGVLDVLLGAPYWYLSDQGDAHIVFTFETQVSAAGFKLLMK